MAPELRELQLVPMGDIGPMEIVLLLGVALLLFGAKRLPEIGRSLGTGMREFKDSVTGVTHPVEASQPSEQVAVASAVEAEAPRPSQTHS